MAEGAKDWTNSVTILAVKPDGTLVPVKINADGRIETVIVGELEGIEGNITVEQDDATRDIQGLDGVTLRTVVVDGAGRLIMVPRGNSGHYMLVDDNGYLSALMKGIEGANLRTIAVDVDGKMLARIIAMDGITPRDITVNAAGHIIMTPVSAGGVALAVDASGFLTCKLSGSLLGITNNITVDQETETREIQGEEPGVGLHTVSVDDQGQIIMVPRGSNDNYLDVDANGFLTTVMKGNDTGTLRTLAVDASGKILAVLQGIYEGTLKTVAVDADGRMETVVKGTKDVTRGLRLWYKFRSVEGANIRDSSPWGNDGIAYSGVSEEATYTDGIIGQAISVDGDNDKVIIPSNSMFDFGTDSFTIECWIKPTSLEDYSGIVTRRTSGTTYWELYGLDGDTIQAYISSAGTAKALSQAASLDTWHHVVMVVDRAVDRFSLYLDNVVTGRTMVGVGAVDQGGCDIRIGYGYVSTVYTEGIIDEVRIYRTALTADEVAIRYNLTKPGGTGSLQEIIVNARGQVEVLAKDAEAFLRNLRVDDQGRLIVVPRGESGHYLAVDEDGYMGAILKAAAAVTIADHVTVDQDDSIRQMQGIEGENLRTLAVDVAGRIIMVPYGTTTVDGTLAVNQNSAIRTVQGIEGENIRTIAVDNAGRMIAIIRGAAGHNVLVDANGYLTSVMKGLDGETLRSMLVDSEGRMEALMKGMYDETLKTIATDEDGRMLSVIRNMPYEDTILYQNDCAVTLGNSGFLQTAAVVADKIWVVTNVCAYADTSYFSRILLSIRRGTDYFRIRWGADTNGGVNSIVHAQPLYLKAGDIIRVDFDTAVANTDCFIHLNGYILPAYS